LCERGIDTPTYLHISSLLQRIVLPQAADNFPSRKSSPPPVATLSPYKALTKVFPEGYPMRHLLPLKKISVLRTG
jgi:hypothetical protein